MADEVDEDEVAAAAHGPRECMPCRGTGKVISGLGGEQNPVTCPWCDGSGERQSGVDAQAKWLDGAGEAPGNR
jgi:DnaJ-class molecular chaperone